MIVSAWTDGHGGYGFRVPERKVGLFFRPEWRWVTVRLPDETMPASIPITESFWHGSPELRSIRIKGFPDRSELLDWEKNRPPQFELEPKGGGLFHLNLI